MDIIKKTLGINTSHNCSFAYFENDILKKYYEEERFNKSKHFNPEFFLDYEYFVLKKFKNINFDCVYFSTYDRDNDDKEQDIVNNILKQLNCKKWVFNKMHHEHHAMTGFYFSKFSEALVLVSDGGGEIITPPKNTRTIWPYQTIESIHFINNKIKTFYKLASNHRSELFFGNSEHNFKINETDIKLTNKLISGLKYSTYRSKAGFGFGEEGQLMGVAAYKNKKTNIPSEILELAHKAQEETLEEKINLIKKAKKYSDCKNIILSGGYHLNCLNNFKLVKHFPELNFFVDPIPYDGGTAVGVALYENYK
jgi:predicted NodU family carbamoyl transferase